MITIPKQLTWLKLVLTYQDTAFAEIRGRIIVAVSIATVATYLHLELGLFTSDTHGFTGSLTHLPFSFVGLALSIFLGFRNSTSYDRFWEGRKLWGQLVNTTRSLSRQILNYADTSESSHTQHLYQWKRQFHSYLIAYAHSLRLHLRDEPIQSLAAYIDEDEMLALSAHRNRPNYLNLRMSVLVAEAWKKGWINTHHVPFFEAHLHELSNLQGGCERIKATPIPFVYVVLLHRLVAIYCFALPFGIVNSVGIYTPFVVGIVSYAFMGLDAIGGSIENPFEKEPHDLPLTQLSEKIEEALNQQQAVCLNLPAKPFLPEDDNEFKVIL